jgi:hypothetical protein
LLFGTNEMKEETTTKIKKKNKNSKWKVLLGILIKNIGERNEWAKTHHFDISLFLLNNNKLMFIFMKRRKKKYILSTLHFYVVSINRQIVLLVKSHTLL